MNFLEKSTMSELYLKKYIRLIFENLDLKNLEKKYEKEIEAGNKRSNSGWGDLDDIIEKLKKISENNQKDEKLISDLQDLLKKEGYNKIGSGVFREVYSKKDSNFVIKIQSNFSEEANEAEYRSYFSYSGKQGEKKYDLFPKLYGYDKKNKSWIIFEKVNIFKNENEEITFLSNIFKQFKRQIEKAFFFIKKDQFLRKEINKKYIPKIFDGSGKIDDKIFFGDYFLYRMVTEMFLDFHEIYNETGNKDFSMIEFLYQNIFEKMFENKYRKFSEREEKIKEKAYDILSRSKIQLTKDFEYFYEFFYQGGEEYDKEENRKVKGEIIKDIHTGNIGYRNVKNNTSEPWKNLVIIDFGENEKIVDYIRDVLGVPI
jgi:hypothetical protein